MDLYRTVSATVSRNRAVILHGESSRHVRRGRRKILQKRGTPGLS